MKYISWILPGILLLTTTACKQESFDARCAREAVEHTRKFCPQKLAEGVMMDSMAYAIPARTYMYYYTLSGVLDSAQTIASIKERFRQDLLQQIVGSVELKKAKEEGIGFHYFYRSGKTGKTLLELHFTRRDYEP